MAYNTFHLFAGAGGGILADLLLGHVPIGACEIEKYPRDVLLQRQRDGILPVFPIWDDVCTLDGRKWREAVDVLCGGFPCQDISAAGKGAGIEGDRSGLWKEYKRLIGEMRPKFVFAENSPLLRKRGLHVVLRDLSELGYNARWGVLGSRDFGGEHGRKRMWVLAYADMRGVGFSRSTETTSEIDGIGRVLYGVHGNDNAETFQGVRYGKIVNEKTLEKSCLKPSVLGRPNEMAQWMGRKKAIGNGQDPVVAATAFRMLSNGLI